MQYAATAFKLLVRRARIAYLSTWYEKAAVISKHHTHVDSFEELQYLREYSV